MIRILVADDHAVVRRGLRQVLSLSLDMTVTAEAGNAAETMQRVRDGGVDLVLLDLSMPGASGVELVRSIKAEAPDLPVLVLSMHADLQIASQAIRAGASGYLTKDGEPEVLLDAIREITEGRNFIDPMLATRMVFQAGTQKEVAPEELMSNREYQVFLGLVRGQSLVEMAEQLKLSAKTISTHKFRLMRKLGMNTMSELVRYAVKQGLVE